MTTACQPLPWSEAVRDPRSLRAARRAIDEAVEDDRQGPVARLERRELIEALAEEITRLPEREARVLQLYYHEELNMKEVDAVLGVTESRVCQLHGQAAARLRVALAARLSAAPAPMVANGRGGSR